MRKGNGQTQGGRMRVDRPLVCLALAGLATFGAVALDGALIYLGAVLVFPGMVAALLGSRRGWGYSYAVNSVAATAGSAVAAVTGVAMQDPTELDSDPLVLTVFTFMIVGFLGAIGAMVIGPLAWVVWRWFGGR